MPNNTTHISKLISFWLRHDPSAAGLTADDFGWVSTAELISALVANGYDYTVKQLDDLNLAFDKVRWEFDNSKDKIRATHGHSFPVLLSEKADKPPEKLYHGTAISNIADIIINGLKPMKRQFVHLSTDDDLALTVGKRHGVPLLIEIDADRLYQQGKLFYKTSDNVWLTNEILPLYLTFEPWHIGDFENKKRLLQELRREISEKHLLRSKVDDLELLMRRYDRDDCLFIDNKNGEIYEIHLTWSHQRETNPNFPTVSNFESLDDWVYNGLLTDHQEWYS